MTTTAVGALSPAESCPVPPSGGASAANTRLPRIAGQALRHPCRVGRPSRRFGSHVALATALFFLERPHPATQPLDEQIAIAEPFHGDIGV